MTDEKQIIYVDASALKHSGCWRKFVWMVKHNFRPNKWKENPYKPAYGTAGHKFLQGHYSNHPFEQNLIEAINYYQKFEDRGLPEKEIRTVEHLQFTCHQYLHYYHGQDNIVPCRAPNGELQIEEKFAVPYWENEKYIVMLCGTRDMRARFAGIECIIDHKFSYHTKGPEFFFDRYEMDIQTLFYVWFEKWVGASDRYLPIMINAIFIHPIRENGQTARFERSRLIEYPEGILEKFEYWLTQKLQGLIQCLLHYNKPTDHPIDISFCQSTFGMCQYFDVCQLDPKIQQQSLSTNFDSGIYNPLQWSDE